MKPIDELTNEDRANLLYELFPEEMPALIDFIAGMCTTIKEDEQVNRANWENGFITFDAWLRFVNEVETAITKYGKRLGTSKGLFTGKLFDGLISVFTIHCICTYVQVKEHPNKKLATAIDLLFNP